MFLQVKLGVDHIVLPELALLADLQRTVYQYKWLPISCRSGANQWKFAGQRPPFYHWATQPTKWPIMWQWDIKLYSLTYVRLSPLKCSNLLTYLLLRRRWCGCQWPVVARSPVRLRPLSSTASWWVTRPYNLPLSHSCAISMMHSQRWPLVLYSQTLSWQLSRHRSLGPRLYSRGRFVYIAFIIIIIIIIICSSSLFTVSQ